MSSRRWNYYESLLFSSCVYTYTPPPLARHRPRLNLPHLTDDQIRLEICAPCSPSHDLHTQNRHKRKATARSLLSSDGDEAIHAHKDICLSSTIGSPAGSGNAMGRVRSGYDTIPVGPEVQNRGAVSEVHRIHSFIQLGLPSFFPSPGYPFLLPRLRLCLRDNFPEGFVSLYKYISFHRVTPEKKAREKRGDLTKPSKANPRALGIGRFRFPARRKSKSKSAPPS